MSEVVNTEMFQGERVTFKGAKPSVKPANIISALQQSLTRRFPVEGIIKALGIASFTNWPKPGSDTIGGYCCVQIFK